MDKNTQLWNEYQSLRNESSQADSLNYQTISIIVGASGVVLTAAINQSDLFLRALIFMSVHIFTIPGYRLLRGNRIRIWRISTYMRVFLEPHLDFIKWETRLDVSRKYRLSNQSQSSNQRRSSLSSLVGNNEWFIVTLINTTAGIAAISSLIILSKNNASNYWSSFFFVLFYLVVYLIHTCNTVREWKELERLGKVEKTFLSNWEQVRDEEENR
jgi:hypothetical protein